jgi:hypothetical protein
MCSYRKLKVTVKRKKDLCPICGEELVRLHYLGVRRIVKVRGSPDYVGSFLDDLVNDDGSVNWCEAPSGSCGSYGREPVKPNFIVNSSSIQLSMLSIRGSLQKPNMKPT